MKSKKDIAYEYLKEGIIANALAPGTPISELAVAEKLRISRTPIREAMRELEIEGLIISYRDRGSFVTSITPSDIDEIYELRAMIESWCLRKGFDRIDSDELLRVKADFQTAYELDDWSVFHSADRKLHGMIVASAASPRISIFMDMLNSQAERIRRLGAEGNNRNELSLKEHSAIIDAIISGNVRTAEKKLRDHLKSVSDVAIEVSRRHK